MNINNETCEIDAGIKKMYYLNMKKSLPRKPYFFSLLQKTTIMLGGPFLLILLSCLTAWQSTF